MKTYQKALPVIIVATAITPIVYADVTVNPDSLTISQGDSNVFVNVLANDSTDAEHDIYIVGYDPVSAQNGTISRVDNELYYTPPSESYVGTDTFTYTANDGTEYGGSSSALVTITVESGQIPDRVELTPTERKIATALDNICTSLDEGTPAALLAACNAEGASRLAAIQQLVPSQLPSQGNYSVELQHNQFMNITSRLVQLRAGATGASASNLSLNFEGQPLLRGGGASADEPEPLGRLGVFINGSGSFGDRDTTDNELGFDFTTEGISAGADYRITDELVLGGALGYVSNGMDFENSQGDQDITGYTLSAYGSWYQSENVYIDGILSYGTNNFDLTRRIRFGTTDVNARGDTDGTEFAISMGGAFDFNRDAYNFGPFARVNYIKAKIDAFEENSAEGLELAYDNQDVDSLTTLLGGQATYVISTRHGVFTPEVHLEWAHEFKHDSRNITARFLNDPTSGRFEIGTDDPDRDYFNLGLGVSAVFAQGRSAFLYYETVVDRDNLTNHSISGGVRFEF